MGRIEEIDLCFENIEVMTIPSQYLVEFDMEDIKSNINRTAINWISRSETAEKVRIMIDKHFADTIYKSFGEEGWEMNPFERIKWNDLCSITVRDEKGQEQDIFVQYESKSEALGEENMLQKTVVSEEGNCYITVNWDDAFNIKECDETNKMFNEEGNWYD